MVFRKGHTPWNEGKKLTPAQKEKWREVKLGVKRPKQVLEKAWATRRMNGWKKSKETIERHRQSLLGKKHSEKTKERMRIKRLGFKVSEETKEKISKANKGMKRTEDFRKLISEYAKKRIISELTKTKIRIALIDRIKKQYAEDLPIFPFIGTNETEILDQLEKEFNIELERQYPVDGYFIDGYDKKNNIAYEVEEGYHISRKGQIEKDKKRAEYITNKLNCDFVRIEDYENN